MFANGAVLNTTVIVLAVVVVVYAVVGTPSTVTYMSEFVESRLNSLLVEVLNVVVVASPVKVFTTL